MAADISFIRQEGKPYCDIELDGNDIKRDNTLSSAVYIMLFTDRRATLEELHSANMFPRYPYDLRGWWNDQFRTTHIGSKLWLNKRRKSTDQVLLQHIQYAREALSQLVQTGVAKYVNVQAAWVRMGVMDMRISITRPDNTAIQQQHTFLWTEVQNALR